MSGNRVVGGPNLEGVGGGLALSERCKGEGMCTPVVATASGLQLLNNYAHAAGGCIGRRRGLCVCARVVGTCMWEGGGWSKG